MLKDESKALGIITPISVGDIKSVEVLNEIENRYSWDLGEIIWDLFAEMIYNQEIWGLR